MIKEHDCVVLTTSLPEVGLEAGDIGTIVHVHNRGEAFEVEFMTLKGDTVAVETLAAKQVRALTGRDVAHARELCVA
jgi:hypothetical protein